MNCKPGDLAVVVHVWPGLPQFLGRVVNLTRQSTNPHWAMSRCREFKEAPWHYRHLEGDGVIEAIPDAWLRPIRDPGDDAQDEMLVLTRQARASQRLTYT